MTITEELVEQIKHRYACFDRPKNGLTNVIIDSFMPSYFIKGVKHYKPEEFPSSFASISEFTADITSTPLVPREDLFRMLGYSLKDLNKLIAKIRSKKLNFVMLGLGGTNSNTLYWLYEMMHLTNNSNLFNSLYIFENDDLSIDNILRMPMSTLRTINSMLPEMVSGTSMDLNIDRSSLTYYALTNRTINEMLYNETYRNLAIEVLSSYKNSDYDSSSYKIHKDNVFAHPQYFILSKLNLVDKKYQKLASNNLKLFKAYYNPNYCSYKNAVDGNYFYFGGSENSIFYGAPDINTRLAMANANSTLITATHGDDDASLILNPINQSELQVESYGMIRLTSFFMNQIRLAIGLLELLASDQDLTERNKKILDFSYLTNTKTLPTSRQWNLQLNHNGLIRDDV